MFQVGERVVHPMHGAGVIEEITRENFAGAVQEYYVFRMPYGGLVLKIPVATSHLVGLRRLSQRDELLRLLWSLPSMEVLMDNNWNVRYRDNLQRLKSGDIYQVAWVVKGLTCRDQQKSLSTGERKLLHNARQILLSEIALVTGQTDEELEQLLQRAMSGDVIVI